MYRTGAIKFNRHLASPDFSCKLQPIHPSDPLLMKATRLLLAAALVALAPLAHAQQSEIYLIQVSNKQMILSDPTQIKDHGSYKEGTYVAILPETTKGIDVLKAQIQHDCARNFANKITIFQGFSLDNTSQPAQAGQADTDWVNSDPNSFAGAAWSFACKPGSTESSPYPRGFRGLQETADEYRGFLRKQAEQGN